jgi:hypothetical protein
VRVSTPTLITALVLVALLWLLSVQFYTGCSDGGCSAAREAIGWLRFPLAAIGLAMLLLVGVRVVSGVRRR